MRIDAHVLEAHLASIYSRHNGPVSFVDETYRFSSHPNEWPFYVMTGSTVRVEDLAKVRNDIGQIAGGNFWHTTDAFQERRHGDIRALLRYIAGTSSQTYVFTSDIKDARSLEDARRQCFLQLLADLASQGSGLIVFEKRRDRVQTNLDVSLIQAAKKEGLISRDIRVVPGTPAAESLLWLPDAGSWALRRLIAADESSWFRLLKDEYRAIDASPEKEKKPEPAAAKGPGSEAPVGHKGEGESRSSLQSITQGPDNVQSIFRSLGNQLSPKHSPHAVQSFIRENFSR
ncbi:hypothetical protein [Aquiluna sp. KACHI24]|uniref:hypothetical protein n=1 Tax=Aquiluna sp. KACHI24 TaxID=2968831 RepID=UPI002206A652|nr:hypothetical protein [Aquiluna sp. KACHI24]BDQ00972.1 hypothetical protein AKACHI_13080 [Aquiluna sp. KACHI24]